MLLPGPRFFLCGLLGAAACGCASPVTSRLGHRDAPVSRLAELREEDQEQTSRRLLGAIEWPWSKGDTPKAQAPEKQSSDADALGVLLDGSPSPPALREARDAAQPATPEDRRLTIAQQLEQRDETTDAEKLYQAVLRDDPRHAVAHHRMGVLLAKRGELSEAERHLRDALASGPPRVELLNDLGYCCYLQGRYDAAEVYLRQALDIDATHSRARSNLTQVQNERTALAARAKSLEGEQTLGPAPLVNRLLPPDQTTPPEQTKPVPQTAPAEQITSRAAPASPARTLATVTESAPAPSAPEAVVSAATSNDAPAPKKPTQEPIAAAAPTPESTVPAEAAQPETETLAAESGEVTVAPAPAASESVQAPVDRGLTWVEDEAIVRPESRPVPPTPVTPAASPATATVTSPATATVTPPAQASASAPDSGGAEAPVVRLVDFRGDAQEDATCSTPTADANPAQQTLAGFGSPPHRAEEVHIATPAENVENAPPEPLLREPAADAHPVRPAASATEGQRSTTRRRGSLLSALSARSSQDEPKPTAHSPAVTTVAEVPISKPSPASEGEFIPYIPPPHLAAQTPAPQPETEAKEQVDVEPRSTTRAPRRALFNSLPSLNPFSWRGTSEASPAE